VKRGSYRKPVKTGKPGIADAIRPGSVDELMAKYDATIRRAKKERQRPPMMIDVTVGLYPSEIAAFTAFIDGISDARKDPFTITPEVKRKTEAAMRFDELVPIELPAYVTADEPPGRDIEEKHPTEDDVTAHFKKLASKRSATEWIAMLARYDATRVKDIAPERRAAFIAEASRDL